jgi:hypothetical protein
VNAILEAWRGKTKVLLIPAVFVAILVIDCPHSAKCSSTTHAWPDEKEKARER